MCRECHATGYELGYLDGFDTGIEQERQRLESVVDARRHVLTDKLDEVVGERERDVVTAMLVELERLVSEDVYPSLQRARV